MARVNPPVGAFLYTRPSIYLPQYSPSQVSLFILLGCGHQGACWNECEAHWSSWTSVFDRWTWPESIYLWELFSIQGHLSTNPRYPVLPQYSPSRQHYLRQVSLFILLRCCTPTTANTPVAVPNIPNVTNSDCAQMPTTNDTTYVF